MKNSFYKIFVSILLFAVTLNTTSVHVPFLTTWAEETNIPRVSIDSEENSINNSNENIVDTATGTTVADITATSTIADDIASTETMVNTEVEASGATATGIVVDTATGTTVADITVTWTTDETSTGIVVDDSISESILPATEEVDTEMTSLSEASESTVAPVNLDLAGKIELRVITEEKTENNVSKTEYYTGEDILVYGEFNISGSDLVIPSASTKITIPKAQLDGRPTFSKTDTAVSWQVTEDDNNYYVTHNYKNLRGGNVVAAPATFRWIQFTTETGFATPVKMEMFDGDGRLIKSATTNYIAKNYPLQPYKVISGLNYKNEGNLNDIAISGYRKGRRWETIDDKKVLVGDMYNLVPTEMERTKDGVNTPSVEYWIGVRMGDTQYGKYRPENIKIVDTLPVGAKPFGVPNANGKYEYTGQNKTYEWTYDAIANTMTYEGPGSAGNNEVNAFIKVGFPNIPYTQISDNKANITILPGTPKQQELDEVHAYTKWNPIPAEPIKTIKDECVVNWWANIYGHCWSQQWDMSGNSRWNTIDGKQVKEWLISLQQNDDITTTKTGDDAPYASFAIGLKQFNYHNDGTTVQLVKVVDILPAGAVMFGEANAEGKYVYDGFAWTYDAATHTATYEGNIGLERKKVNIKLSFPGQPYATVHENTANLTFYPGDAKEYTYSDIKGYVKFTPNIIVPTSDIRAEKYARHRHVHEGILLNTDLDKSPEVWYGLEFRGNNNNVDYNGNGPIKTYVHEIIDYGLDSRLYYNSIYLHQDTTDSLKEKVKNIGYKVYGVKADNTEVFIGSGDGTIPSDRKSIEVSTDAINDVEDIYEKIKIVFNSPLPFSNEFLKFIVDTRVKPDIWSSWKQDPSLVGVGGAEWNNTTRRMKNTVDYVYTTDKDSTKQIATRSDSTFFKAEEAFAALAHGNNHAVIYGDDNTRDMYIRGHVYGTKESTGTGIFEMKNPQYTVTLPVGINYVPGSARLGDAQIEPTIVTNWKDTGKTALIFKTESIFHGQKPTIDYKVDVTPFTAEGQNTVEEYLSWDNDKTVKATNPNWEWPAKVYKDQLDIDNDGNYEENFLRGTNIITFIPPREVILKKFVGTTKTPGALSTFTDIGSNIFYKISLLNNSLRELQKLDILDVLPVQGDHTISPNEFNNYPARESIFPIELSASLESLPENTEVLKKFSISYSVSQQGDNLASVRDANFVPADQIDDFTKVKTFKISLKPGQQLPAKTEVVFIVPSKIPTDPKLVNFTQAINSSAVSLNNVDYSEGNKVSSVIVKYKVEGKVYFDTNNDGNIDENEKWLTGYQLQLMNADGTPARGLDGNELITTSDKDGNYSFNVYARGNYYVKALKKDNREILAPKNVTPGEGNDATVDENDATEMTLKTSVFSLNPTNIISFDDPYKKGSSMYAVRNIGLNLEGVIGKIIIKKIDADNNNLVLSGAVFDIKKGDEVVDTVTTDENGSAISKELIQGFEYSIVEKTAPANYRLDTTAHMLILDANEKTLTVMNTLNIGKIIIKKVDADNNNIVLSGAVFEIRKGDEMVDIVTTDENGSAMSKELLQGVEYGIIEKTAPIYYQLDTTIHTLLLDATEKLLTVTNTLKEGKIIIKKIDADNNNLVLSGAVFDIKKGDEVVDTVTTNENGVASTTAIKQGTQYTVVEKTAPEYYQLDNTARTVILDSDAKNLEVANTAKTGKIIIKKVDSYNTQKTLENATFEVFNADDMLIDTITTDKNGAGEVTVVQGKTYKLVEKTAPIGYKLDKTPMEVTIVDDIKYIVIKNSPNDPEVGPGGGGGGGCGTSCVPLETPKVPSIPTPQIPSTPVPPTPELPKTPMIILDSPPEEPNNPNPKIIFDVVEPKETPESQSNKLILPKFLPKTGAQETLFVLLALMMSAVILVTSRRRKNS